MQIRSDQKPTKRLLLKGSKNTAATVHICLWMSADTSVVYLHNGQQWLMVATAGAGQQQNGERRKDAIANIGVCDSEKQ